MKYIIHDREYVELETYQIGLGSCGTMIMLSRVDLFTTYFKHMMYFPEIMETDVHDQFIFYLYDETDFCVKVGYARVVELSHVDIDGESLFKYEVAFGNSNLIYIPKDVPDLSNFFRWIKMKKLMSK